jgi:hypothetical protein
MLEDCRTGNFCSTNYRPGLGFKNHIQNGNYKGNEKEAIANKDSGPVKQELALKN